MNKVNNLKNKIEKTRSELNELIVSEKFEVYYQKSVELDQLIEEYIDLTM